jgi:UDP-N-acetylmuramate--alanine ligase
MSAGARPWSGRRIHLVGVGGAGMSAYARAARALGARVSGSDASESPYMLGLREDAILEAAVVGHAATNVPFGDDVELFYSSAIPPENAEREAARKRGLPELPRAALLAELTSLRRTIAVAGTHGKTTSAAMIVHALRAGGLDPGWLIGAGIGGGLENGYWSEGEWLVVEADESDRSMLELNAELALLTNVELDHHSSFASLGELREVFREFLRGPRTAVIWERPELLELREGPVVAYDTGQVALAPGGSSFRWRGHEVRLSVPGLHNALNATAALEVARLAGAEEQPAVEGLAGFPGAARRFQALGRTAGGALLYDDYAHHPTEVAATLDAARSFQPRRLVAVFQPHLFSRTVALAREFGRALAIADAIAVLEIYPARERAEDYPDVSGLLLAEATADAAAGKPVFWLPSFAAAERVLARELRKGDLCVLMGAGHVDALGRALVSR